MHTEKPIFTAQFHPEAFGGPTDTEVSYMALRGLGIFGGSLGGVSLPLHHTLYWNCFFIKNWVYY